MSSSSTTPATGYSNSGQYYAVRVCMNDNSTHHRITTESSISMLLEEAEKLYNKPANSG